MSKNLLMIFTRNPELGKVKTRLAKTIGDKNALFIYKILLQHTVNVTQDLACDKAVYYSVKIRENDLWDASMYQKLPQHGEDLGIRMKNAFADAFAKGYEKVIIIGSDLYDLRPHHIEKAFDELEKNELVIGPSEDGGYYLLGMKTLHEAIFHNKAWGTETVRQDTLNDLQGKRIAFLEELNDIDVYEDLKKHKDLLLAIAD